MQLGMVGLGRMGANIVRRLMRDGHECVVSDVNPDSVAALASEGAVGATSSTLSEDEPPTGSTAVAVFFARPFLRGWGGGGSSGGWVAARRAARSARVVG